MSVPQLLEWAHLVLAMCLVGGQILITVLTFWNLPRRPDGDLQTFWAALGRSYTLFALFVVVGASVSGFLFLRYTLISIALLRMTPYGPLLALKVALAVAFTIYLVLAPPWQSLGNPGSTRRARITSVVGSGMVLALAIVSYAMRYA